MTALFVLTAVSLGLTTISGQTRAGKRRFRQPSLFSPATITKLSTKGLAVLAEIAVIGLGFGLAATTSPLAKACLRARPTSFAKLS